MKLLARFAAGDRTLEMAAGWPLLVAATLGCGAGTSSLLFYSLGVFVEPLQRHFAWTRGEVTSVLLYGGFALALAAPALGWLIDRYGVRAIALVSIPCFAAILYALSRFDSSLTVFYAWFVAAAVLGSGTTPILYTRAVAGHFDKARGLALGITLAGPGTAAVLLPPFLLSVIEAHDWRAGFAVLAAIAIAVWPLALFGLDRRGTSLRPAARAALAGTTRRQALRTRVFWTIAAGFGAIAVAGSALVVHMVPMLRDAGVEASRAARIASLIGVGVILGRVGIGWVIDRVFAPHVAAVVFALTACGCMLLATAGPAQAPLAAFLIGFTLGAEVDLMAYLTSRYFGLAHYGFLYATVYACFWIGIATGPALAGRLFDATGDYRLTLMIVIGLLLFGAAAAASLPRWRTDG